MRNSEGSARVFAGVVTALAVFFLPRVLAPMLWDSSLTIFWALFSLAAAWVAVSLVSLKQRVKQLEMKTAFLQEQLDKLEQHTGIL